MAHKSEIKFRKVTEAHSGRYASLGAYILLCGLAGELSHQYGVSVQMVAGAEIVAALPVAARYFWNTALEKWVLGTQKK